MKISPALEPQRLPDKRWKPQSTFNTLWPEELGIPIRTVIDAGSFDGTDAIRFREEWPQADIIAIEADPLRSVIVTENTSSHGITSLPGALLDHDGMTLFYRSYRNDEVGASGSIFKWNEDLRQGTKFTQDRNGINVLCTRLDTIIKVLGLPAPDLLHADVEGANLLMLKGMGHLRPKIIFLETAEHWHSATTHKDTEQYLAKLGYTLALDTNKDALYVYGLP